MVLRVLISIRGQQQQHHFSTVTPTQGRGWAVNWMGSVVRSKVRRNGLLSEWVSSSGFRCRDNNNNSKQETPLRVVNFRFLPIRLFYGLSMSCHHHLSQSASHSNTFANQHPSTGVTNWKPIYMKRWTQKSTFRMVVMITPTSLQWVSFGGTLGCDSY